jgi:hypothetical protein
MTALRRTTKARLGVKAAKTAVTHPRSTLLGGRVAARGMRRLGPPLARRGARNRAAELGDTVRSVANTIVTYVPPLARELSSAVEPPPRPRTAPRVAAGFVLGAGAMYFLEPEQGAAHRASVRELVAG